MVVSGANACRLETRACVVVDPIIPTRDEQRNGWTSESLTRYLEQRKASQAAYVGEPDAGRCAPMGAAFFPEPDLNPTHADNAYDPFRW